MQTDSWDETSYTNATHSVFCKAYQKLIDIALCLKGQFRFFWYLLGIFKYMSECFCVQMLITINEMKELKMMDLQCLHACMCETEPPRTGNTVRNKPITVFPLIFTMVPI